MTLLQKKKKNFDVILLSANKNHKEILKQAKILNAKNLIINNDKSFKQLKKNKFGKIKIFNNYDSLNDILIKKIDYVMCAISGIQGLEPTVNIIKHTKKIAIANKESIICGWNIINRELKKNNTQFIPVDSEHFSLWYGMNSLNKNNIEKIYITASGGPFYKKPLKNFNKIKVSEALNHPNWKMGKKISTDSATMINKIYEVIEAKNIFNINYNKIDILIHPKSYVHAILKFTNGLTKIIVHDTTMKIPIFNTLFFNSSKKINSKKIDIASLNNLDLKKINPKRYPMIKLIKLLPEKQSLFETVIVSANDQLVELFLEKKISFLDIQRKLFKIIKKKEFLKLKKKSPKNLREISDLNKYVRLKITQNSI